MKIGIDLDGVLFNSEIYFATYGELYDIKIGGKGKIDPEKMKASRIYGWDEETKKDFIDSCLFEVEENAPLMPYSKEVLQFLHNEGHELIIITSRGLLRSGEIELTKKRLQKENLKFDKEFYAVSDKSEVCEKEKIDLMIEDYCEYIEAIASKNIKCLQFNGPLYRECNSPYVTVVNNWGEILRYIKNLNDQNN